MSRLRSLDEARYLAGMLTLAEQVTAAYSVRSASSSALRATVATENDILAVWQTEPVPERYQYISLDFGNWITNAMTATAMLADVSAQVERGSIANRSVLQSELDLSRQVQALADTAFRQFMADLHAEFGA